MFHFSISFISGRGTKSLYTYDTVDKLLFVTLKDSKVILEVFGIQVTMYILL